MTKCFDVLVILIVMVIFLADKAHPQRCFVFDIEDCIPAMNDNTPPSEKCCDELRQQKDCQCPYLQVFFEFENIISGCHIELKEPCPYDPPYADQ